ncbi:MAG: hypothetical protein ACLPPF_07530 [Rhodomicrobium sp.]
MKAAFLLAAAVLCASVHMAKAERVTLICQWSGGAKTELQFDGGNVRRDGTVLTNVIGLTVSPGSISYYVDNLAEGGFLEHVTIERSSGRLDWTAKRFDRFRSATARCERVSSFIY